MPSTIARVDLTTAIRQSQEKADKAQASDTESRLLESRIRAADSKVSTAGATVTRYELTKKEAEDKLSPPPTKQVQGDGKKGGTKTVVDERERDKLQSQVRAADVQIQQAQAAVEAARQEAEALKTQSLQSVGITEDQMRQMGSLDTQINQLKLEAERGGTDLVGEDYQRRLGAAVTSMTQLSGQIPDAANTALKTFWDNITANLTFINRKITEQTTPDPIPMPADNNYQDFFNRSQQGFNTVIDHLRTSGASSTEIMEVENMRDSINSNRDVALIGLSDADKAKMQTVLQGLAGFATEIQNGDPVTMADIRTLTNTTTQLDSILGSGGSNFETNLATTLNAPARNIEDIKNHLVDTNNPGLQGFADDYTRLTHLFDNPDLLDGLSVSDYNRLVALRTQIGTTKASLDANGSLTDSEISSLATNTHTLMADLYEHYGITDVVAPTSTGGGGTGGGGTGGGGTTGGGDGIRGTGSGG